ncbi:1-deoxy-D-xylulose-5-phosphate synthase [Actinomadura rugatobispora]|uniref:1-deoxy-D-xylulose-5-phosphate synthase n=1 Tax=Actinomadura rugatobispora TaxID=1994 RepID=A0ABW1AFF1_9ACTN|nr:1-deoxy-D-xylulose-5-phosphate synthase N-terminal domain-containing protein [Actinomadura rugatobispora]
MTPETITGPEDLRGLPPDELRSLAAGIRRFLVDRVSRTGGHLGPNLGVVELTLALHRVFASPRDRILWDTGHQAYVHKIVTGRAGGFGGLRQPGGLSGYPSREESEHDLIENSHASTALSIADGLARARRIAGDRDGGAVVAVVGDGALTGGVAWEALNNIGGDPDADVVVVLNDNGRSYAPTVGGLARHLAELRAGSAGASIFEELGLAYIGPVDGHDIPALEQALREARAMGGPVVVHAVTVKGAGYVLAENDDLDRFHAVRPMASGTGPAQETWTDVFGAELARLGGERSDLVAITAAMLEPTGLSAFAAAHPDRTLDVGIAEQHAAASAAGLALGGLHPVVAVYATFLNRAFDQLMMDVALHRLPVTFVLDRAGITGDDGPSHNGMWDLSILRVVPGLRVAAPRDGRRLRELLAEAVDVDDGPTAVRFPKGAVAADVAAVRSHGAVDVLRESTAPGGDAALIVAAGAMAGPCMEAAELLEARGVASTVVDPRWVAPLDPALAELAAAHATVTVVEDNGEAGGVGDAVAALLREAGVRVPVTALAVPQRFIGHGKRPRILEDCGLTGPRIAAAVESAAPLTALTTSGGRT